MKKNEAEKNKVIVKKGRQKMITHRVIVKAVGGEELVRTNFESSTDAEKNLKEIQMCDAIEAFLNKFPAVTIALEEIHFGEWVVKERIMLVAK